MPKRKYNSIDNDDNTKSYKRNKTEYDTLENKKKIVKWFYNKIKDGNTWMHQYEILIQQKYSTICRKESMLEEMKEGSIQVGFSGPTTITACTRLLNSVLFPDNERNKVIFHARAKNNQDQRGVYYFSLAKNIRKQLLKHYPELNQEVEEEDDTSSGREAGRVQADSEVVVLEETRRVVKGRSAGRDVVVLEESRRVVKGRSSDIDVDETNQGVQDSLEIGDSEMSTLESLEGESAQVFDSLLRVLGPPPPSSPKPSVSRDPPAVGPLDIEEITEEDNLGTLMEKLNLGDDSLKKV